MVYVLLIFFSIIDLFVFILISNFEILFDDVEFRMVNLKIEVMKCDIKIVFKLFNKFKVISFKVNLLKKKFLNLDFKQFIEYVKFLVDSKDDILFFIKPKVSKLNVDLIYGIENLNTTVYLMPMISIFISLLINKSIIKYKDSKIKYKIIPCYNRNVLALKINAKLDLEVVYILFFILDMMFRKKSNTLEIKEI